MIYLTGKFSNRKNFGEEDPYDVRLKRWILEKQNEIESNIIKLLEGKEELNSETRPKYVTCLKRLLETIISMYKEKCQIHLRINQLLKKNFPRI